jgi:hypothetical protein
MWERSARDCGDGVGCGSDKFRVGAEIDLALRLEPILLGASSRSYRRRAQDWVSAPLPNGRSAPAPVTLRILAMTVDLIRSEAPVTSAH